MVITMRTKDYELAKQLKDRLSNLVPLLDFRVFGSRVREEHAQYSDMDLFLEVASLDKELEDKIYDIAWEVGFENFMVLSIHIFTRDEIENSPLRLSPIVRNIFNEGVRV